LSLILRPSGLRNRLSLRLHACAYQRSVSRIHLLPTQFLHLLARVAVTMSCLFRELSHLPLAGLFSPNVSLLRRLTRSRSPLI
jgi:hypothetical protein